MVHKINNEDICQEVLSLHTFAFINTVKPEVVMLNII